MSMFSKQDYELINLGVCIKNQADRLDIEHEGVPLEGVVVRIAKAAIAARRESIRLLTAGVVAEEPEWEYGIHIEGVKSGKPFVELQRQLNGRALAEQAVERLRAQTGLPEWQPNITSATLIARRKASPWVPVKQEGEGQ